MSNFMKILQMGAELFHGDALTAIQTDRQTDRHDKANSHFSHFCK